MGKNVFDFLKSTEELEVSPIFGTNQNKDLHFDENDIRIWLSRTGSSDGEPYENRVLVECYDSHTDKWEETFQYPGDEPQQQNITVINQYLFNTRFDYE